MSYFVAIRKSRFAVGLSVSFWLLVTLILIAGSLRSAHVLSALVLGTLSLLCLGYSLYGRQFSRARWRSRSALHHVLWFVVAVGAVAGMALSIWRFLV
ncbi:MAG TPA: hypothetical protein VFW60_00605 [Rhodanobacteraceae bacterium]|nr:hypothetical protein [Rhodanobacteraceae bacterium]